MGFLLLEIMVSIAIITGALIFVMRVYSTVKYAIQRSGVLLESSLLLESKMFDFEERGDVENDFKDGKEFSDNRDYSWSVNSTQLPEDPVLRQGLELNLVTLDVSRIKDRKDRKSYITKYFITTYLSNKR
jgi:hypothetical protein